MQKVFALIDEEPETDEGYVRLVNAKDENGNIIECERTGMWAWKHPHCRWVCNMLELTGDVDLRKCNV